MTILELEVLLHHYYSPSAYPHISEAARKATAHLVAEGMIRPDGEGVYTATPTTRGMCYVKALKNLPLPVMSWGIPYDEVVNTASETV